MKLESTAETQPQLQPALLRLAAIISQYFFRHQGVAPYESWDAPEGKTDAPRSYSAAIRVYDEASVIETHEQAGEFREW